MRRALLALLVVLGAVVAPQAGSAAPTPGFASTNIEWLGNVPLHADSAGARLVQGYLYVTSSSQLSIYDARVPESPVLLSTTPLPQMPYFAEEDVDTDGRTLVIGTFGMLVVLDVTDKRRPAVLSTLRGADEHTESCVLSCSWIYGSAGTIVDLRDRANPKIAGKWTDAVPGGVGPTHDVTEVAPGLVVTSSQTIALLDARQDPARPRLLTSTTTADRRFIHANLWPRAMKDSLLLVGGETEGIPCDDPRAGAFMTFGTAGWQGGRPFTLQDSYRPAKVGVPQGGAAYETYCSHWFDPRPGWKDGGQVVVGWYEHGTRLLDIARNGTITETGYFVPAGTTASAAYWASDDIVYVLDYNRGLDILRVHDGAAPRAVARGARGLRPDVAPAHRSAVPGGPLAR